MMLDVSGLFSSKCMPSRRSRREKNRAKKITKLNDDSCANDRESQDIECEERDSFQEAREKKNTFERNRYKANSESKTIIPVIVLGMVLCRSDT